jgi:hypothetical protein
VERLIVDLRQNFQDIVPSADLQLQSDNQNLTDVEINRIGILSNWKNDHIVRKLNWNTIKLEKNDFENNIELILFLW